MEDRCCWICLQGEEVGELQRPCTCPRFAHATCLSRWCLQKAGKEEERQCRFCSAQLPSWREAHRHLPKAVPIFSVVCEGVTHQLAVEPGPHGEQDFLRSIRQIFNLAPDSELQLTFGCKVPGGGDVTLETANSYDAAVHLASLSAGQRLAAGRKAKQAATAAAGQREGLRSSAGYAVEGESMSQDGGCLKWLRL